MNTNLEKFKPNIGQAWRTNELYLKIKGNTKYLYALMDDETGFWIAQQVAETKNTADITPLFSKGKKVGEEPDLTL
jgi:putative transposase